MKKAFKPWWHLVIFSILSMAFTNKAFAYDEFEDTPPPGSATYSGQATVLQASVLGIPLSLIDTGPLPSQGGALEASLIDTSLPLATAGNLLAQVFHATTIGQGNQSSSEASVANLNLSLGLNLIKANFIMARASATCGKPVFGSSEIASLEVNGKAIAITGQPNQVVNLIAGSLIINEQISSSNNNSSSITVNALHLKVVGLADVVISSAHADINCQGSPPCQGNDFVTGGGYITVNSKKANFAVAGGIKNGFWGHLTYIDHGTGMKVHGTGVTSYEVLKNNTRRIKGTAKINNQDNITYTATVVDAGEPGTKDSFRLQLSTGYDTSTKLLSGGNIQLHKPCN